MQQFIQAEKLNENPSTRITNIEIHPLEKHTISYVILVLDVIFVNLEYSQYFTTSFFFIVVYSPWWNHFKVYRYIFSLLSRWHKNYLVEVHDRSGPVCGKFEKFLIENILYIT